MNSKYLCAMIFFSVGTIVIAQEDPKKNPSDITGYLNFSVSMGINGNINSQRYLVSDKPALSYNIDVSLTPEKNIGFFINYASADLNIESYDPYLTYYGYPSEINYSQFMIGPRFYSNSKNSFIDAGIGYLRIESIEKVGATLGIGGKIKLTDLYAVNITGRVNAADVFDHPFASYSLTAGFEINNKNDISSGLREKSKISIGALAGSLGTDFSGNSNNSFGAEVTYDVGKQTALLVNYVYSGTESKYYNLYFGAYDVSKYSQTEITGGVRLYMKGNNLRVFFEGLTGAYLISVENSSRIVIFPPYTSASYYGITFGGGVEFKIVDHLSGLVKTDVSNYIKEGSYFGLFGGLKYRL